MTHQELATSSKALGSKDYFRAADKPLVPSPLPKEIAAFLLDCR